MTRLGHAALKGNLMLDMAVINGEAVTPGGRAHLDVGVDKRADRLPRAARLVAGGSGDD